MTVSPDVTVAIRNLAERVDPDGSRTMWFVFGSSALEHRSPADVDLMVVCDRDDTADEVRRAVDVDKFAPLPIHLSIFTVAEEEEIGAVKQREAVRVA